VSDGPSRISGICMAIPFVDLARNEGYGTRMGTAR
jgi:hypothetical protein